MNRFRIIVPFVLLLTVPLTARAELASMQDSLVSRFNAYSALCSPEKVYLHYDRSCFTAGETIWFKGWTMEASRRSALPPSNFIYAEILDKSGEAVVRVKVKRSGDGFPGCIELPDDLEAGEYTIRAYSLWQLNNDSGYLFNDGIRITGGRKKSDRSRRQTASGTTVSFWPEGGRYFAGHRAVIGFKAVDGHGRSVDFAGILVDDSEEKGEPVRSWHDGMGFFSFTPEPGHSYSLRDASGKLHPLPPPSEEGATLQLRIRSGRYYVSAIGTGGGVASLLLRDASEMRPIAEIGLNGEVCTLMMEKSFFHPGINHFLIVDNHGRIIAERLFFV